MYSLHSWEKEQPMSVNFSIKQVHPNAVPPSLAYKTPVGLDFSICHIMKVQNGIVYAGTGWIVIPQEGYYFVMYERSSTHKSGWSLVNKTGIFDPDYRGP
jgi:dUTPase